MKKALPLLLCLLLLSAEAWAQVSFGHAEKINNGWLFLRVDTAWNIREQQDMKAAAFDDHSWRHVTLPHDWGVELPMSPDKGSCQGYLPGGIGWYRKHLELSPKAGRRYYVYFEGVYHRSEVWINGHLLGKRPSGFASFLYDLTPWLQSGNTENVLAVRADHSDEADARWYTGSGIYRNVWLVEAPEVHLAQWGTAWRLKSINQKNAIVEVDVETTDERSDKSALSLQAVVKLTDAKGNIVAEAKTNMGTQEKKTVRLTIKNPQRWTLSSPYLYRLTTQLDNGDCSVVRVGLRTLDFSPDRGFALNGEWMKMKGVCLHDDAGVLGTAVPTDVWRRRLIELKSIGVNAIRMSHNPHAPLLYDLCDELGLMVMDEASDEWEFPKRKWLRGWNQGVPGFEGSYTYFEEWIERDVADMVRRDRCHPSVVMWSIGNEVDYPNDPYSHPVLDGSSITQPMYGGYKPEQPNAERIGIIAQRLARIVKDIDSSRPTTGALAGVVMSNETAYPEAVDIVGYNYTESRYDTDHKKYPKRVIYGSENRHDLDAWKATRDNAHIFGQFLWTGIDYLGESGVWPARGSSAGLLDLAGQRKPMGWYRAALWSTEPTCYIGSYPIGRRRGNNIVSTYAPDNWNYEEGERVRVVCYTNAPSAQLILNDKPVDATPQRDPQSDIIYWDLPFQPGHLCCQASNGAAYDLWTNGRPHTLKITTDKDTLRRDADEVVHVFVEVTDQEDHIVKQADNEVTVSVEGGTLLGIENGNIQNNHAPRRAPGMLPQNRLHTLNGRLVAYVKANNRNRQNSMTIKVSAPLIGSQTKVIALK